MKKLTSQSLDANDTLPTLYKKTSTGAIQLWDIWVEEVDEAFGVPLNVPVALIWTEHGQVNGKLQITSDKVTEGKNVGKANETTPVQQAIAEATATWQKKKKSGYVESIKDAEADKVDDVIEGGILPMLAFTFEKQGHKIKYPCYAQPKLDGIRCIAILKDGACTLWSRTRKPITSCPHIIAEIERNFEGDVVLDGELYSDEFKDNFEHIVHLVRQETPDPEHTDVEYHVYDMVNKEPFSRRYSKIFSDFHTASPTLKYVKLVETLEVESEEEVTDFYTKFKSQGYEGAILRNLKGLYANKRSADLIKVKEMQDAEFEIAGIEEGRGKLSGHVGAFICYVDRKSRTTFKAKMSGATERLQEYFEDHSLWKGKKLTVQFQDLTSYGIPRFPVGKSIRDYE